VFDEQYDAALGRTLPPIPPNPSSVGADQTGCGDEPDVSDGSDFDDSASDWSSSGSSTHDSDSDAASAASRHRQRAWRRRTHHHGSDTESVASGESGYSSAPSRGVHAPHSPAASPDVVTHAILRAQRCAASTKEQLVKASATRSPAHTPKASESKEALLPAPPTAADTLPSPMTCSRSHSEPNVVVRVEMEDPPHDSPAPRPSSSAACAVL